MKTHWKKSFDSPYLGSWDLEEYKDVTLTIEMAVSEKTKGLKEDSIKNILYFKEDYKPMICNSGNSKTIKNISGSNYMEDWKGVKITLFVKEIRAFGENHDALRVKTVTDSLPTLTKDHKKYEAVKNAVKGGNYTIEQVKNKYEISKELEKEILS